VIKLEFERWSSFKKGLVPLKDELKEYLVRLGCLRFSSEWNYMKTPAFEFSPEYEAGLNQRLSNLQSLEDVESKFLETILPRQEEDKDDSAATLVYEIYKFFTENKGLSIETDSQPPLNKQQFKNLYQSLMDALWKTGITQELFINTLENLMANRYNLSASFRAQMERARRNERRDPRDVYHRFCSALCAASTLWNQPSKRIYSPYFPLLGPSMCGKSYLLQQVSGDKNQPCFFVYNCFRGERSSGIPEGTHYFQTLFQPSEDTDCEIYYRQILIEIVKYIANMENPSERKIEDFNKMWMENSKDGLKYLHSVIEGNLSAVNFSTSRPSASDLRVETFKAQSKEMLKLWDLFEEKWSKYLSKSLPGLVLAFDEASVLLRSSSEESTETLFLDLRRALQIFPQNRLQVCPPVTVFTDTTATIADYCPAPASDGSLRVAKKKKVLLPPFYRLAFVDVYVDDTPVTLNNVDDFSRLLKYGRPFWGGVQQISLDEQQ
jgi:hypothetical protein